MLREEQLTDPAAIEILNGASELFMRYGVKSITMDEIARHLSISKKTIYQHFSDKDELVLIFAKVILQKQQDHILALENNFTNIIEGIMHMSDFVRSTVCNINPSLLFDLKKYFPKAWKIFQTHKKEFLKDHIKRMLVRGVEQGYFRNDINLEVIARMRIEIIEMAFNPDVFPTDEFLMSEVNIQMFKHFMIGISTLKGYEEFNKLQSI